jgi:hypothetical protein
MDDRPVLDLVAELRKDATLRHQRNAFVAAG